MLFAAAWLAVGFTCNTSTMRTGEGYHQAAALRCAARHYLMVRCGGQLLAASLLFSAIMGGRAAIYGSLAQRRRQIFKVRFGSSVSRSRIDLRCTAAVGPRLPFRA